MTRDIWQDHLRKQAAYPYMLMDSHVIISSVSKYMYNNKSECEFVNL